MTGVMESLPPRHDLPLVRQPSRLAIVSLLCGLILVCPLATLAAPVLGIIALQRLRRQPELTGGVFAWWGIGLGVVAGVGWLAFAGWLHVNVRGAVLAGPESALRAGLNDGDPAGFRAELHGIGGAADLEVAESFLATVASRYGELVEIRPDTDREAVGRPFQSGSIVVPYMFEFTEATVPGRARFLIGASDARGIVARFDVIHLEDPESGDLWYPRTIDLNASP